MKLSSATGVHLIHQALARARRLMPQSVVETTTEAPQSALTIAMQARRREAARQLGL
ncbi:hypothetical protein GCM10010201_09580 [Pilimelia columellifera subsp. columellifera]|uniref:Uncharacterized protein n=1 Tax=Pilimelia columellifera subsp. columellifera TaxID=706583 RepID=A0ABP6AHJ2_9ACTN